MRPLLPIFFCVLGIIALEPCLGEELDSLLAPHAERYDGAVAELQKTRAAQLSQRETEYVQKLDAAISSAKDEATIAALRKEREGVVKGLVTPANGPDFPEEITAARKAFLNGVGKAVADYQAAKKKLDDAYLKTLAGLAKQPKGKTAPPGLVSQIAAEKRRVAKEN